MLSVFLFSIRLGTILPSWMFRFSRTLTHVLNENIIFYFTYMPPTTRVYLTDTYAPATRNHNTTKHKINYLLIFFGGCIVAATNSLQKPTKTKRKETMERKCWCVLCTLYIYCGRVSLGLVGLGRVRQELARENNKIEIHYTRERVKRRAHHYSFSRQRNIQKV